MLRVTFLSIPTKRTPKRFENVELHRSEADAKLRASALGWVITKIETV